MISESMMLKINKTSRRETPGLVVVILAYQWTEDSVLWIGRLTRWADGMGSVELRPAWLVPY